MKLFEPKMLQWWNRIKGYWPWAIVRADLVEELSRRYENAILEQQRARAEEARVKVNSRNIKATYEQKCLDAAQLMTELRQLYIHIDRFNSTHRVNLNIVLTEEMFHMYRYEDATIDILSHHIYHALRKEGVRI